jgi:starvation-inducible DNA-binding protein
MDREQLILQMKTLLASSFSFYLKVHNYHWNVTGPNFAQYHDFFGDLYEEVWQSLDDTAEEIRKLGAFAPGSLSRYIEMSVIDDEVNIPDTKSMFIRLEQDNAKLLEILYMARATANEEDAAGTLDYLESRIGVHEKHAWMIRSFN